MPDSGWWTKLLARLRLARGANSDPGAHPEAGAAPESGGAVRNTVDLLFAETMRANGFRADYDPQEDLWRVSTPARDYGRINLGNARRLFAGSGDPAAVRDFTEGMIRILRQIEAGGGIPDAWEKARDRIFPFVKPADMRIDWDGVVWRPISERVRIVYVYDREGGNSLQMIPNESVRRWGVHLNALDSAARANLADIARAAEIVMIDGVDSRIACIETREPTLMASLLLTDIIWDKAVELFGEPVCATMPAREIVYLCAREDGEALAHMAGAALAAHASAAWPISCECFHQGENGIEAVGRFAVEADDAEEDDADGAEEERF